MKVITIVGARPQFIKAAPVSRELRKQHSEILVHSGQHYDYDMSDIFFKELDIPHPEYNLGVGSGSHALQTGNMLMKIEEVILKEMPDWVLVYGDTNSTLAGALAAAKLDIPIAHVEAGLRSYNRKMPEEINRVIIDHISTLLFCPTTTAAMNLNQEGISKGVHIVGDVMFDCMLFYLHRIQRNTPTLKALGLKPGGYVLATVHRAQNTDNPQALKDIVMAINDIGRDLPVILALHPRTRKYLDTNRINVGEEIRLIEPLSYLQMIEMEYYARLILTDSGGVQKEAFFMGKPCLTLREETEWIETLKNGTNILCGTSRERIMSAFLLFKNRDLQTINENFYGNGDAARKIVNILDNNTL